MDMRLSIQNFAKKCAAVAEGVEWSSSNLKVGSWIPSLPKKICMPKCP